MQNQIIKIIQDAIDNPYEFGTNDCNLIVLRMIDLINGTTTLAEREYTTVREGIAGLNKEGWNHTGEIVEAYCDEVQHTIDGDIWLDPDNPLIMALVASGRVLGVNQDHTGFELQYKPTKGKYYRVRKQ
ncbi:ornithine carbamoyltransferase [Rahnella aquatilis]|nr:ornithine carbamoyltransferase [Rahnella aquatilis]AZP47345.1 ornithine carbamoyltransferase [Rahnella aquatilis]